jgi:hypothetical protein
MTTKAEKDRQKQIQEKCQALLTQMLRDEDNKYCVDCDAKGKYFSERKYWICQNATRLHDIYCSGGAVY